MAIPPPEMLDESWVREAFLREYTFKPTFFTDDFRKRLPTVESIKRDVAKLRSPSEAGRRWIEDRRMAIASVGPWRDTLFLRRKGEAYPAIMMKARQQGVTYSYSLQQR